jgi:formylglycine-generating enzyme required for sulfatase activity
VESVSWEDIGEFLDRLNQQDPGHNYRLPTEAQWEYAARAGTTGAYGGTGDLESMGWWAGNSAGTTRQVATKSPNAWGLFDMHGNVWELTADLFADDYYQTGPTVDPNGPAVGLGRVVRGGAYSFSAASATSFNRGFFQPADRHAYLGFRLVRDP